MRTGSPAQQIQVLRNLIQSYGISPDGRNEPPPDPRLAALENQIYQMQAGNQAAMMAQQQARVAATSQTLHDFATQKDDAGNLAHPYFGELEQDMTRLAAADVQAGLQPELNDLYERAMWSNARVREKVLAAQDGQKAEERRKAARKARRAGSSISGGGAPPSDGSGSIREILEAEYKRQVMA